MRISLVILSALFLLFAEGLNGQDKVKTSNVQQAITSDVQDLRLEEFSAEIRKVQPAITGYALNCDQEVISSAFPDIAAKYQLAGFQKHVAQHVSLLAWKKVRQSSPLRSDKCMNQISFSEYVATWGKIVIESEPSGADIEFNGTRLNQKTGFAKWYPEGSYNVRLTKPGFKLASLTCAVEEGKESECKKTLEPVP